MANYTKITNFAAKDSLASGSPAKIVKGTDIDNELNAISTAIATKVDTVLGGLQLGSGTVSAPSYSFLSATSTGLYLSAANQLGLTANGHLGAFVDSGGGFNVNGATAPTQAGMYLPSANTLGFATNSTQWGTLNATGNWTLNNPSSGNTLAVVGAAGAGSMLSVTDSTETFTVSTDASHNFYAGVVGAHSLNLRTNSAVRLAIASAGNVTVAAPSSGSTLGLTGVSGVSTTGIASVTAAGTGDFAINTIGTTLGQAAFQFSPNNSGSVARVGAAGAGGQLITGSSTGDLCLMTNTGGIKFSKDGSAIQAGLTSGGLWQIADSGGTLANAGYLGTPVNSQSGNYTAAVVDRGKTIVLTGSIAQTVTINNSIFAAGDVVTILNNNASANCTIAQGAGVTMTWANGSTGNTGSRTSSGIGLVTILFTSASACVISGAGLS